ncbi:hypothetical protein PVAND_015650 [Polypedilum vanderplanki]|uniref:Hemolymph juvenile hormone binding protein n=1 Tax=Polypedilum vanderplanki TaxID=319348 RepID=A0A9J6BDQ9_POLVA|nr:hypothetical protein PVAND_015650 [Polypedilum vanderplanki]
MTSSNVYKDCSKVLLLISLIIGFTNAILPKSIEVCSRNDEDIEKCIVNSVMKLQPLLASGKLDDGYEVPAIEPFRYDDFIIEHGPNFRVEIRNLESYNGSNFSIEKFKFNIDKLTFDFIISVPKIRLTAKYKLKVKLTVLDIAGNGDMESTVKNSKVRMKLYGKLIDNSDGTKTMIFEKANVRIIPGESKIFLKNLFNGDPTLGKVGNDLINENQDLFLNDIVPVLEKQFSEIFKKVANDVIGRATVDEILPDKPVN